MGLKLQSIQDVAEAQLCCGCGVCAYLSPDEIRMVDVLDHGRRPSVQESPRPDPRSREAFEACPGREVRPLPGGPPPRADRELFPAWGPVIELFEGHAVDLELRYAGSSGGAASAIALYAIERGGMHGVLHIAPRPDAPYLNQTVLSTRREQLLAATGSRYAPASPCDGLKLVEEAPGPCVFIGKPCDVAGVARARSMRPALDRQLGLTVAFFCAGAPSTRGTLEMIQRMGVKDLQTVRSVRYRGMGWPGRATVVVQTEAGLEKRQMTYEQSWGEVLQKHRQWRCYICPDHIGELSDIAVADPWYREIPPDEPGRSLILARTERGLRALLEAERWGYLRLEKAPRSILPASQPNLYKARASVWGRLLALRLLGAGVPRYAGMRVFRLWWSGLSLVEKARSILGTARRVARKGLRRRAVLEPMETPGEETLPVLGPGCGRNP